MKDGKANQYGGTCRDCGAWVGPGEGVMRRSQDENGEGFAWAVVHAERCPEEGASAAGRLVWGVPAEGRTPEGHQARGYAIIEGYTDHPGAVPLSEASAAAQRRTEAGDRGEAPRGTSGAPWLALAELDGLLPRRRTVEEIDAALEGRDVAEMRAALETARAEILARFGVERAPGEDG